jgi:hypothetical protein
MVSGLFQGFRVSELFQILASLSSLLAAGKAPLSSIFMRFMGNSDFVELQDRGVLHYSLTSYITYTLNLSFIHFPLLPFIWQSPLSQLPDSEYICQLLKIQIPGSKTQIPNQIRIHSHPEQG